MTGGFPCTPFTQLRNKKGKGAKQGAAETHPQFKNVMEDLPEYLRRRCPESFIVEEVCAISRALSKTGRPFLSMVVERCTQAGYSVVVLKLNHNDWIDVPRERLFLLGFRSTAGGQCAAKWAAQKAQEVMKARRSMGGPIGVWEVLGASDPEELAALTSRKVGFKKHKLPFRLRARGTSVCTHPGGPRSKAQNDNIFG